MTRDKLLNKYKDANKAVRNLLVCLEELTEEYTNEYERLSWNERQPNIIKTLYEAGRFANSINFLLWECALEEEIKLKEESVNGETVG